MLERTKDGRVVCSITIRKFRLLALSEKSIFTTGEAKPGRKLSGLADAVNFNYMAAWYHLKKSMLQKEARNRGKKTPGDLAIVTL